MKSMIRTSLQLCALLGSLLVGVCSAAEIDKEKREEIEKLLVVTGAMDMGQQMSAQFVSMLHETMRKGRAPSLAMELMPLEVNAVIAEIMPAFKEMTIEIYDRYYTTAEIRDMINFYESQTGKKVIKTMPSLMQETMAVSMKIGERVGPEVVRRIEAKMALEKGGM